MSNDGAYVRTYHIDGPSNETIEFNDLEIDFVEKENIKSSLEKRLAKSNDPTNGMCLRFSIFHF